MWRERAACRDVDPELFYPLPIDQQTVDQAKAVCRRCPVITECHTDADRLGDAWAIRGGLTAEERAQIRMIGRPCHRCAKQAEQPPQQRAYCSRDCARAVICGTRTGVHGHRKQGEPLCTRCRAVKATEKTERKHRRRAEAA